MRPHRPQSTRLPRPWDSPGKNTGVGCHFLLQCMQVKGESEVTQSCLTLSDPMDCSPPGSSVHGILQARVLEWGAIAFSHCSSKALLYSHLTLAIEIGYFKIQCSRLMLTWNRKQQPTPVFLPENFRRQRSLADYSPWGPKELATTERLNTSTHFGKQMRYFEV